MCSSALYAPTVITTYLKGPHRLHSVWKHIGRIQVNWGIRHCCHSIYSYKEARKGEKEGERNSEREGASSGG